MLRIFMLGSFELRNANGHLVKLPSRKSKALLALLLLRSDHAITRSALVDALWGEMDEARARRCLSSELWRVCRALNDLGIDAKTLLETDSQSVSLKHHSMPTIWLDVCAFNAMYAHCMRSQHPLSEESLLAIEECIALYRGDLLEGIYDTWCWMEREDLRNRYLQLLRRLLNHHKTRLDWPMVVVYGRKLLALDPLQEDVHRDVIEAYLATGNRSAALRQFKHCARCLQEELGCEPMPETQVLFKKRSQAAVALALSQTADRATTESATAIHSLAPDHSDAILKEAMQHIVAAEDLLTLWRRLSHSEHI